MKEKLQDPKSVSLFLPVITTTNENPGPQSSREHQEIPVELQIRSRQPSSSVGVCLRGNAQSSGLLVGGVTPIASHLMRS